MVTLGVTLSVTLSRCVCVRRISLAGEGNALYPVLSGCFIVTTLKVIKYKKIFHDI